MAIIMSSGIGLGMASGAAYIDLSKKADVPSASAPEENPQTYGNKPWAEWGTDNQEPQRMIADIEKCGVLNAGIDGKARFAMGNGIKPMKLMGYDKNGEILEPAQVAEVDDFLEASNIMYQSFGWLKDQLALAKLDARFVLTRDKSRIAYFQREDPCTIRLSKAETKGNNMGKILNAYLSYQWENVSSYNKSDTKVMKYPLIPQTNSVAYLYELMQSKPDLEYIYSTFYPSWNKRYYPKPLWTAAYDWVRIAQGVPKMKAALYENNIRLKYMVIIDEGYWQRNYDNWNDDSIFTDEKKQEAREQLYNDIENYLVGSLNAYKTIFVNGGYNLQAQKEWQDIKVVPIADSTKQGELLPDSAAANSEILFAIMMNPALMGADMPGGPYSGGAGSGSNIREAGLVQVMIQEFERRQIAELLRIVQRINKWPSDIVWRFPGLVLTTLDTGGSMKTVNNG